MTDPQTARDLLNAFTPRTVHSDLERVLETAAGQNGEMVPCPECGTSMPVGGTCPNCGFKMAGDNDGDEYSQLTAEQRKNLNKSDFAIPEKAPGSGSYPIPDIGHARNALARASGKPEESRVKAAVLRKYPQLKDNDADD